MDQYEYIRTGARVYKKGVRELARETGHSRVTIRHVLRGEPKAYSRRVHQSYPVLEPFLSVIDEWLQADKEESPKQRHTARRVYHRLCVERGYGGSEEAVRRYVRQAKRRLGTDRAEVFIVRDPECGREAEVDWGQANVYLGGVKQPIHYFCMRPPFSGKPFVRGYLCEKQQAFFDAHMRAFQFYGGIFSVQVYDNLSSAVQKVLQGRERIEQEAFRRFRTYYSFEARFCNAGCGNEKGGTEGLIGFVRRNFLVPIPRVDSLEQFNEQLLEQCLQYGRHVIAGRAASVQSLFEQEKGHLLPLPEVPFTNVQLLEGRVDQYGTVMLDKNRYSVPERYEGRKVRSELSMDRVEVFCDGTVIARHERVFGSNKWQLNPDHYLEVLQRKPGAFDTARVIRQWRPTWPPVLEQLLARCKESQGWTRGIKDFISVLLLYREHDAQNVTSAIGVALQKHLYHSAGIKQILLQTAPEASPSIPPLDGWAPTSVPDVAQYGQLGVVR